MLDSRNLCKVQRVKVVGKQQPSPKVDEMKVLSEKEIREFLANDNKDVVEDGLACQSVVARRHPSNWRKSSTLARGIGCRVLTNNHDRILRRKT